MARVYFLPQSQKEFNKLPQREKAKIQRKIIDLGRNPRSGKKLKGKLKSLYSIRSWPYRIIYKSEKSSVVVLNILHRQGAYKK